jgi:hypothetical protein
MSNIIDLSIGNNSQEILPVPYQKNPVPSVESPVDYNNSPFPVPIKPTSNRVNDNLQYCNFLAPAPRDQRLNVPYEGDKNCPKFTPQPYKKDSCYLMDSKAQGVVGIVCNQSGGSDNADFYRGNQFGVDYDENLNKKKLDYIIEKPVQLPMELENPMMIYDNNTFYPYPSFELRKNKDFITYPLKDNFTEQGLPIYVYPYKTLNPIVNNVNDKSGSSDSNDILEKFENTCSNTRKYVLGWFVTFIFIFCIIIYFYLNK